MHPEMHTDAYMHTNCLHHGLVARVLLRLPVCGNVCDVEQETAFVVLPDFLDVLPSAEAGGFLPS